MNTNDTYPARRQALLAFMDAHNLTATAWAKKAGVAPNSIYGFLKGKHVTINRTTLERLAESVGAAVTELTGDAPPSIVVDMPTIRVLGYVAAGIWQEAAEWDENDMFGIGVPVPNHYRNVAYGLMVRGESMNLEYPDGTVLICVPVHLFNGDIEQNEHVIVHRTRFGQVEATVKELRKDDAGRWWLWPRSSDPRFQQPIGVAWPPAPPDPLSDEIIEVTAIVIGSYRPRPRRG